MIKQQKILFIEDDLTFAIPLKSFFEKNDFDVIHTNDGAFAIPLYETEHPDIILLDIDLPNKNGFEIIAEIREANLAIPVIFMTGTELSDESVAKGYSLGAFNYFKKPVLPQVLLELVKNLLQIHKGEKKYFIGGYDIAIQAQHLQINGNTIILREKEAAILEILFERKGRLVNRNEIIDKVWKIQKQQTDNTLDVAIFRLKKALLPFPHIQIINVYGSGYMLAEK